MSTIEERVAELETAVAELKGKMPVSAGPELDDSKLNNDWADKEIKKDPPRYTGPSMIGRRYSQATAEWHTSNAGYREWCADKGRKEVPVKLNNKGKPWHESDTFEAKICRAWARRNAGKTADELVTTTDDSGLPF